MPKSRNGRRFLALLIVAVVLVGAWLLVAKPLSNKKTEVAVEKPITEKQTDKKAEESANKPSGSSSGDTGASSSSDLTMPSELTTTGSTGNLAVTALLMSVAVYLVLLNRSFKTRRTY
ncbi:MAG: hypothetical protein LBL84_03955 [Candidatus Nomurabacteria bacterium]|nr:hypothetical protein [Candidatus Nomurabacteria bacterium]